MIGGSDSENEEDETKDLQAFAVKLVRSDDEEMLNAHEREFDIIKSMDHPNVVRGIEVFKDITKNEVWQVMELVDGLELLD